MAGASNYAQQQHFKFPEDGTNNMNNNNNGGYGMIENLMKKDNNNDQLNYLKKIHTLNSEYLTHRDHQDVKKQFEKVKEVIDPSGNVSFTILSII